ncbi:heavy metal translocating P-type ATPase [Bacillus sp. B1-b2]|uniref:heavy metal translocating P-type ATPase n=1 Tax=Bacillus sp. B1-b2 TaxID=2653201 RepID=UPI0012614E76|nr:heavy metal translocating P-type ATPase [Bacillus sp. B1-b2]KAB7667128.1 copper-translocating P-type ATPase [Bacillus sp. B1-b2]
MKQVKFNVEGMSCGACSARIEKSVGKMEGIQKAQVNLASNTASVYFDETQVRMLDIEQRVEKLGFHVAAEKAEFYIDGMTCAACSTRIEKRLGKTEGIKNIAVSLTLEKAALEYYPDLVDQNTINKIVHDLGYQIRQEIKVEDKDQQGSDMMTTHMWVAILLSFPLFWAMADHFAFLDFLWVPELFMNPWFQLALATPVQFAIGARFYQNAYRAVRSGGTNMDLLVALGTSAAYFYSVYLAYASLNSYANHVRLADIEIIIMMVVFVSFLFLYLKSEKKDLRKDLPIIGIVTFIYLLTYYGSLIRINEHDAEMPDLYFETSAVLITLILVGKTLESRAKKRSNSAMKKLLSTQVKDATVIRGEEYVTVQVSDLQKGEIVLVKAGEKIPIDGYIVEGSSFINEAVINGESIPSEKQSGDRVYSGTMNQNATFKMKVDPPAEGNIIDQIIRIVEEAQLSKAPVQRFADKISGYFIPIVIISALAASITWLTVISPGDITQAIHILIAVLVISCPCALGLATPVSIMAGTGRAAELGVLFKGGEHLELARKVDTIVFDKTGTLTKGEPTLVKYERSKENREEDWLEVVLSAELHMHHPIAEAVVNGLQEKGISPIPVSQVVNLPGYGLQALVEKKQVFIGNYALMTKNNIVMNEEIQSSSIQEQQKGFTVFYVSIDGMLAGYLCIADTIREDAVDTIKQLKAAGHRIIMLTGDSEEAARSIAEQVGADSYRSNVLPQQKYEEIEKLKAEGAVVAMVGDGVNDAPALAAADTGIAIGSGSDFAIESSDITLLSNSLNKITTALDISKQTMRNIKQNLFWALIYNVVGIPFAAMGLLAPEIAGAAMAFSSVSVVMNALRLQFYKP